MAFVLFAIKQLQDVVDVSEPSTRSPPVTLRPWASGAAQRSPLRLRTFQFHMFRKVNMVLIQDQQQVLLSVGELL